VKIHHANKTFKPIRLHFTGSLFNTVVAALPKPCSFICYNCDKRRRAKRYAKGTDCAGTDVRVCLKCSGLYKDAIVKSMIDKVIVPALVRELLDSRR
jgi:hypothetical protein